MEDSDIVVTMGEYVFSIMNDDEDDYEVGEDNHYGEKFSATTIVKEEDGGVFSCLGIHGNDDDYDVVMTIIKENNFLPQLLPITVASSCSQATIV